MIQIVDMAGFWAHYKDTLTYLLTYDCRSADERAVRDGTRRSTVGSVTSVNSSSVKRLFIDDSDRAPPCDGDMKRPRRDDNDAEVYTLKVCNNILLSCAVARIVCLSLSSPVAPSLLLGRGP